MGVNNLPKTVTGQRRDCDLNPGPSAPESSALTTRLPSHLSKRSRGGAFIAPPLFTPATSIPVFSSSVNIYSCNFSQPTEYA